MRLKRMVVGPFGTNCYLVGAEDTPEVLVVDPGAEPDRIADALEAEGLRVALILSTHGHVDHTAGVARLKERTGAPYALHPKDIPFLRQKELADLVPIPGFREPPDPDLHLKGGDTLEVAGLSFLVLETPGHSPGSVCLYGHGLLFSGDTLFQGSIGRYDLPGSSGAQLRTSLLKLVGLPDELRVLPGHGPETVLGEEKRMNPFLVGLDRGLL